MIGVPVTMPVALAPTGLTGMQHADGEMLAARAAERFGLPFTLPTMSICSIEDVASVTTAPFWFQLYMMKDRDCICRLMDRNRAAGPKVFRLTTQAINPELVMVIGLFALMMLAKLLNWTVGGVFMRSLGVMQHIPPRILMPIVLLVTLTAIFVQEGKMFSVHVAIGFGLIGYLMRKLGMSVLPFVIAYILADDFERTIRQAFAVSGADPWFLAKSPLALAFLLAAVVVAVFLSCNPIGRRVGQHADKD